MLRTPGFVAAILLLSITSSVGLAKSSAPTEGALNYGIGVIEDDAACIEVLDLSYVDDRAPVVEQMLEEMDIGTLGRNSCEVERLSSVLPEWACGSIVLICPRGEIVAEAKAAYVGCVYTDYGYETVVGIEVQVPSEWLVPEGSDDRLSEEWVAPRSRSWVIAVGPASNFTRPVAESREESSPPLTERQTPIIEERLEHYKELWAEERGLSDLRYWSTSVSGVFERCGKEGELGGPGAAVAYCFSTGMEFAVAFEIIDEFGDTRVEVVPWEGIGEFHGWFCEPLAARDVDCDGWDELIVFENYWEDWMWEIWDPVPDGRVVLASTGGG